MAIPKLKIILNILDIYRKYKYLLKTISNAPNHKNNTGLTCRCDTNEIR